MLDGMRAQFAAEAGTLVATEGQRRVHQTVRIDPYRTCLQAARDAVRFLYVTGPDRRRQAVRIVVRLLDDLINIIEGQHGKNRTKDLFARDLHVVLHVTENRGLDEESLVSIDGDAMTAGHQLRPVLLSGIDEVQHGLHLFLADDCAEARLWIERIRGTHLGSAGDQLLSELVFQLGFQKQAGAGIADLAFTVKNSVDGAFDCVVHFSVSENYVGRFASEFEGHAFERVRSAAHDFFADGGGTGERDLVDPRVGDNGFTRVRAASEDVHDSGWESGFNHRSEERRVGKECRSR